MELIENASLTWRNRLEAIITQVPETFVIREGTALSAPSQKPTQLSRGLFTCTILFSLALPPRHA